MGRIEADREDLFAEATGLAPRLRLRGPRGELVAGMGRDGRFVIYLGQDLMLGFDGADRWRRAYEDGLLYRAGDAAAIIRLRRERTEQATDLRAATLPAADAAALLERWRRALFQAWEERRAGDWQVDAAANLGDPAEAVEAVDARWRRIAERREWKVAPALRR